MGGCVKNKFNFCRKKLPQRRKKPWSRRERTCMTNRSLRGKKNVQNTEKRFDAYIICRLTKIRLWLFCFQYKLEPTPDPTDDEEDSEEEEEDDDDMFGGGGKGADDPAAQAASKKSEH